MTDLAGIGGLIVLGFSIWALINVLESPAGKPVKTFWCLFILIVPLFGFIAWLFVGPRGIRRPNA